MPKTKTPRLTSYHHGNLREALIDAAVQLVEEGGPDNVSVREVAKRAGVSPGAPFRHFSNKTALMTAVAEQAMSRFRLEITNAVDNVATDDPIERFAAVGVAYLRWAIRNPTHFQIISTRSLIDWDSSESLRRDNEAVRVADGRRDGGSAAAKHAQIKRHSRYPDRREGARLRARTHGH